MYTNRKRSIDKMRKIRFDCLVIVFTATVMVIKTTKIAHFLFFCVDDSKTLLKVLSENMDNRVSIREKFRMKIFKNLLSQQRYPNLLVLRIDLLLKVAQNPIIHSIY